MLLLDGLRIRRRRLVRRSSTQKRCSLLRESEEQAEIKMKENSVPNFRHTEESP